jgi:Tfp pilus assembly protein PilV
MLGISRCPDPQLRRLRDGESGFALIEVMVSAVLLIVLALSTAAVFDRAQNTSSVNRSRGVAATLAQSDQEAIRQLPMTALAAGYHPVPATKTVGGIPYTVTSTAVWTQDAGGPVTCSSTGGRVEYLRTQTTVTWPAMGSTKPVVADGIVSPGVAALGASKGALTVLLSKADGSGTPGIPVTVEGITAVTDENGCAVIGNLDAGNQTLSYSVPGYVDKDGVTGVSRVVTIGSGTIAQATGYYDRAGRIAISITDEGSPAAAANWPQVTFDHTQRSTPTAFPMLTAGAPQVTATVFPFASAYKAYVGSCPGNDPTLYQPGYTKASALVTPGNTTALTLPMRTVTVNVIDNSTGTLSSFGGTGSVVLIPDLSNPNMTTPACGSSSRVATSAGVATLQVPFGTWKVCADGKASSGKTPWWHATTTVGGTAATDDPLVVTPAGATGTYVPNLTTTLKLTSLNSTASGPAACA